MLNKIGHICGTHLIDRLYESRSLLSLDKMLYLLYQLFVDNLFDYWCQNDPLLCPD